MYLSKVHISPGKSRNAYELHRALWQLFPGRPDDNRSFLFRVESLCRHSGAQILLQSEHEPSTGDRDARCLASKPVDYRFSVGQQLRFRLRCNPVKAVKDECRGTVTRNGTEYVRSLRVPLIHDEQQQQWLEKKLQQAGAQILVADVIQEAPVYFRKSSEKRSGKIQPVLFEGALQVIEPEPFYRAVIDGIGPAKSFGMGLLSLASV